MRELLKEAAEVLRSGQADEQSILAKHIGDVLATPEPVKDIEKAAYKRGFTDGMESTAETARAILGVAAILEPNAMEIVRLLREGWYSGDSPDDAESVEFIYKLTDSKAAALIESYSRRVPRAMLNEIYDAGRSFEQGAVCPFISDIADKHGYKVEG